MKAKKKAPGWGGVEVLCPFYRYEDSVRIICEGIGKRGTCANNFLNANDKDSHRFLKCDKNYKDCILYRALITKYEK